MRPLDIKFGDSFAVHYTNYKGVRKKRNILPTSLWFGSTKHHPEDQWILTVWDLEKGDYRDFALKDIEV